MRLSSKIICVLACFAFVFELCFIILTPLPLPNVPQTAIAEAVAAENAYPVPAPQEIAQQLLQGKDYPERLIIPSIRLDTHVEHLGVNAKGEMDVPDGSTNNVGWYQHGTLPGNIGSAVIDAHVFAAFRNLRYVKVGADVYVITASGKKLHFRAADSRVFKTNQVSRSMLFNQTDAARLNLITCAGKYVPSLGTYDHRLIVFAVLVDEN